MYPIQYMHARAGGAINIVVRKHFSRAGPPFKLVFRLIHLFLYRKRLYV
jgi:hypothetical protein